MLLQFHRNIHKYISISLTESKAAQAPIKHTVTSPPGIPCTGCIKHIKGGGRTRLRVKRGYGTGQTHTAGLRTCAFSGGSLWSAAGCPSEEPRVAPSPLHSPWLLRRRHRVLEGRQRKEGAEGSGGCLPLVPRLWMRGQEGTVGLLVQGGGSLHQHLQQEHTSALPGHPPV